MYSTTARASCRSTSMPSRRRWRPPSAGTRVVPGFVASYGKEYTHSYAGFGQVTDEILPKLNLTAGIRYTVDLRTGNTYNTSTVQQAVVTPTTNVLPICPATGVTFLGPGTCAGGTGRATFSSPSGKVSLDYRFTNDIMGYLAYNRGFKSGVFNVVSIFAPQDPPVKPEKLDAYTIGEKAEFLDHRLRVNTEAYYYKFTNIQEQVVMQDTSHAVNAAKATMEGLELEVTALPAVRWSVTGSIGLEKAYFNDYSRWRVLRLRRIERRELHPGSHQQLRAQGGIAGRSAPITPGRAGTCGATSFRTRRRSPSRSRPSTKCRPLTERTIGASR